MQKVQLQLVHLFEVIFVMGVCGSDGLMHYFTGRHRCIQCLHCLLLHSLMAMYLCPLVKCIAMLVDVCMHDVSRCLIVSK